MMRKISVKGNNILVFVGLSNVENDDLDNETKT